MHSLASVLKEQIVRASRLARTARKWTRFFRVNDEDTC
jgi:hypothetical protein